MPTRQPPQPEMIYRFHHVHIVCRDLDRMIRFFSDFFNAGLVARKNFGGAEGAVLDLGGTTVNLRVAQDKETLAAAGTRAYGYHHIGVAVGDLDAEYARLRAAGFAFVTPPKTAGDLRIAFFKGPEEIVIELVQAAEPGAHS